jgi:hypothetical protein
VVDGHEFTSAEQVVDDAAAETCRVPLLLGEEAVLTECVGDDACKVGAAGAG